MFRMTSRMVNAFQKVFSLLFPDPSEESLSGEATVETVWNCLRKLKMELLFDPAIPLLGLYPENPKTPFQKNL